MKNKYKIIAICGKSASGKDTLLHEIMINESLHEIVSYTTRPPREHEVDGVNYYFLTEEEFFQKVKNGEMLETSHFRDWYYGTALEGMREDAINIGVFNPDGIRSMMKDDRIELFVVMTTASDKVRLLRSLHREANPDVDEIVRRYLVDKEDFELFSQFYEPDYILDTEGLGYIYLEEAAREIVLIAIGHWAKETN